MTNMKPWIRCKPGRIELGSRNILSTMARVRVIGRTKEDCRSIPDLNIGMMSVAIW